MGPTPAAALPGRAMRRPRRRAMARRATTWTPRAPRPRADRVPWVEPASGQATRAGRAPAAAPMRAPAGARKTPAPTTRAAPVALRVVPAPTLPEELAARLRVTARA